MYINVINVATSKNIDTQIYNKILYILNEINNNIQIEIHRKAEKRKQFKR